MKEITLTINDKQVKGKEGNTLLEVCRANGIDVPTLCHMDGLSDRGACRMCVVEVEKERKPVPSCTYPARDDLVVKTHTPELEKHRRLILELIFTERNHFCMFCEKSGDCELQKLAYRYQMDNVRYPYTFPSLPVDSLSDYLVIDHNRCVLCGRCVRACSEVEAIHTLDFGKRGWKTVISADLEQPLGESSCLSCGACVQACPTGAIFSKLNMYVGKASECQQVTTVCSLCGCVCELMVLIKDNNLVATQAPNISEPRGALCQRGRFDLLRSEYPRLSSPLLRNGQGKMMECTMEQALEVAAEKLRRMKGNLAGIVSSGYPNETLALFARFMHEVVGSNQIDTLDGRYYRLITEAFKQFQGNDSGLDIECRMEAILDADCVMVVGADPVQTHPVIGSLIRRAKNRNGAKIIVIDEARDVFPLQSDLWLKPAAGSEQTLLGGLLKILIDKGLARNQNVGSKIIQSVNQYKIGEVSRDTGIAKKDLESAMNMYGGAKRGIIIYGEELLEKGVPNLIVYLLTLADLTSNRDDAQLDIISLKLGANSRGAWQLGLAARDIQKNKVKGVYLLLGDEPPDKELTAWLNQLSFLAVQASYHSPITSLAHVVFPSPTWAERDGTFVSMDGRLAKSPRVLRIEDGRLPDEEIFMKLAQKLGHNLEREGKHG